MTLRERIYLWIFISVCAAMYVIPWLLRFAR
jgi:hypothetical protein